MGSTTLTNPAATVASVDLVVPTTTRKVTYVFDTGATSSDLRIPYAVAVDGEVSSEYHEKPKRVRGKHGTIEVDVAPGKKVQLYLNSDAHPSYRKKPVYAVTVADHDVKVKIKEKTGKHSTPDTPQHSATDEEQGVATYDAPLTGDIWMKVTHRYDTSEVDALLPAGTRAEVKAAVRTIYEGLSKKTLTIHVAATDDEPAAKLAVTFNDSSNPKNNITSYDLLKDGLPRVHPAGYAAVFGAALAARAPKMTMSSAWRPCMGSIAHRAGLGLDVSSLGEVRMNREELLSNDPNGDTSNVSDEEKKLYEQFEKARAKETAAAKDARAKQKTFAHAKKDANEKRKEADHAKRKYDGVRKEHVKGPPAKGAWDQAEAKSEAAAERQCATEKSGKDAQTVLEEATDERKKAEKTWSDERDKNQPEIVKAFRDALAVSPAAAQLFDPWLMDSNTHDHVAATSNLQEDANEKLHATHLHLTVYEPKILAP